MLKNALKHNETYLFLVIVVFSLGVTIVNPAFMTLENMFDLARSSSATAILAIGFFMVLLSGGIDVSFPAVAISGQYIAVNVLIAMGIDNLLLAFLISIAVGLSFGLINAFFITTFRLPTLIVTLGTLNMFHGALLEFVGTKAVNTGGLPDVFKSFGKTNVLTLMRPDGTEYGLSIFFLVLIIIAVGTWLILRFTILGRGIYALGGDPEAARRAGFNLNRIQVFLYCYAGLLAGIMGIMHVSLIRYSNPNYIVDSELLKVIAAVVLGGASITGGKGSIIGTLLGVLMITVLEKNLVLLGLSSYWQQFFVGLILVLGVSVTHIQAKIRNRNRILVS